MISKLKFIIFSTTSELPANWDEVAQSNAFLQIPYLKVLEKSAPTNMSCLFIGVYEDGTLVGVALAQYINVKKLATLGARSGCMKNLLRNLVLRQIAAHVLFIGNNMITGQNGYAFSKTIGAQEISTLLRTMADELIVYFKKQHVQIQVVTFKDFYETNAVELRQFEFSTFFSFSVQPNMVFHLRPEWKSKEDYGAALSKKYRDQMKRAQKKYEGIQEIELDYDAIVHYEERLYTLYHHVASNASFNTFFLAKNHFSTFKKQLGERFKIFGHFYENNLVGFHTLLLNGSTLETYFLGYDPLIQKEKMMYLTMLYNMTLFGIENQFERIIFGRTALEIKSSIGAIPIPMYGFMFHTQPLINWLIPKLFKKLEPAGNFEVRHPFKTT